MTRQKVLAFLLAILPVAYIYAFPIIINNLGNAIFLFLVFPMLIMDFQGSNILNSATTTNKRYVSFCVYLIIISILAPLANSYELNYKELFSALEFSVILYFLINDKEISQPFIQVYPKLAFAFALILLFQYLMFVVFGTIVNGDIPFLEVYSRDVNSISEGRILRLSSVFQEPSHISAYEIPALIMILFGKTEVRRPIIWIIVISSAILLSTSSNGIILMGIVYFAYIIFKFYRKINMVYFIFGGVILFCAFYLITNSEYIDKVTYGLFVQESDMTTSKAELRIYRGFNLYRDLPIDKQLFGVGWREAARYCQTCNHGLFSKYDIISFDYFNSIAGTLIYSGIIGLILLLSFFYSLWHQTNDFATRTLIISVLVLMCSSSVLMSDQWILFLTAIISLINKKQCES